MTVRDSITRTRARTPGVEDDPTSATVRDRALGPTQCGISDVATPECDPDLASNRVRLGNSITAGISNLPRDFAWGLHCQRHNCGVYQYVARNCYRQCTRELSRRLSH